MTYTFNLTATQAIDMAFKMLNIVPNNETSQYSDYTFALNMMNLMFKDWSLKDGIKLWKRRQGSVFLSYNQNSYELGSVSGSDNCSNSYVSTTLSTGSSQTALTVTLTSVSGMSVNDNIGIELDDLSRQWTTISAINTTTKVVTLNAALTNSASSGNTLITYTNKINRPLEILRGTLLDLSTGVENPFEILTFDQYFNLPIKTNNSRPINAYYDQLLNNSLPYTGTLHVYGNPDSSKYIINFTYKDTIQDVVNASDILDFPQEWQLTIIQGLALKLSKFGYGKLIEAQAIEQEVELGKEAIKAADSDNEYLTIVINSSNRLAT